VTGTPKLLTLFFLLLLPDEEQKKTLVDKVWRAMWRFNQTYTINTAQGDQTTVWCTRFLVCTLLDAD
jgi:hypothetical protein